MRVFLSYVTQNSTIAGLIKDKLDGFGFKTFLAHEDIQPTEKWMKVIKQKLEESDIFLPLLTAGIEESIWCNQEIGIAYALDKLIIPIKIEVDPPGFLSQFQALKFNIDSGFPLKRMLNVISNDSKLGKEYRAFMIEALGDSNSWAEAGEKAEYLCALSGFTKQELKKITQLSITNNQIYGGWKARNRLFELLVKHKKDIDPDLLAEVKSKFGK